jgi:altronate dehydratase
MLKKINAIHDLVKHYLTINPKHRDNDNSLIATIWAKECGGMSTVTNISAYEFLKLFADRKLTNPETIRRARQRIQQEYPELRGETYLERQQESKYVKQNI